jgi:hypothetical protein
VYVVGVGSRITHFGQDFEVLEKATIHTIPQEPESIITISGDSSALSLFHDYAPAGSFSKSDLSISCCSVGSFPLFKLCCAFSFPCWVALSPLDFAKKTFPKTMISF